MSTATPPPATLVSVSGMLQVVPSPPPRPASPPQLLTQKQVRELRRLCRKTANRAEFDSRPIQLRQIASIAAMASPSFLYFDPDNPSSGATLRQWVEFHRAQGADWKDERPLPQNAIDELRSWDRLLKVWARVRFENPNSSSPTVERRVAAQQTKVSSSPVTPYRDHLVGQSSTEVTYAIKGDGYNPIGAVHGVQVPLKMSPASKTPVKASPSGLQSPPVGISPAPYEIGRNPVYARDEGAEPMRRITRERVTGGALLGVSSPIRAAGAYESGVGMMVGVADSVSGLGGGVVSTPVKRNEGKLDLGPIGTPVRKGDRMESSVHGTVGRSAAGSSTQIWSDQATVGIASHGHREARQGYQGSMPMMTPGVTPVRDTYASRVAGGIRGEGLGGVPKMEASPRAFDKMAAGLDSDANRRGSEIGISRVGDTINITVPTVLMSNMRVQDGRENEAGGRYVAREDQENVYPPVTKRSSHLHAVNTAKSWRKEKGQEGREECGVAGDKEAAFRNAAKNLVPYSAKESVGTGGVGLDVSMRSDMDWGKLRRPALRMMPLNGSQFNHTLPKN
eukprot:GFKZ01010436.1.p1 GENE.GFKZ01010436.1~~GFKZ01010436.1.p1  ORF type:complete len:564 (+),score=65.55 GFKZ01010436.1:551-2242(+)